MSDLNIFDSVKPQVGKFFSFKEVGDSIQGTYVDKRDGMDSFGNEQFIYVLVDSKKEIWNVGFRKESAVITERMKGVRFGQIVGFRYDEERDSKRMPGKKAKIIRIYADPRLVDNEWLAEQKAIEEKFGVNGLGQSDVVEDSEGDYPETTVVDATPVSTNLPTDNKVKSQSNEALVAIRNLAKTKGLTNDKMSEAEADATIEKYTGLTLTEENLTKVIIALTGFTNK